jgi:uncharacterized membrane protein YhaH (DUF805 family)
MSIIAPASQSMYLGNSLRLHLQVGLKTWRDTFVFHGRSTRTELISYAVLTALVVAPLRVLLHFFGIDLDIDLQDAFGAHLSRTIFILVLEMLPYLPLFALAARRAHDHDRPGWPFAIIAVAVLSLSIWRDLHFRTVGLDMPPDWLRWVGGLVQIAFFAGLLWQPTIGANRYGEDPRLTDGEPSASAA